MKTTVSWKYMGLEEEMAVVDMQGVLVGVAKEGRRDVLQIGKWMHLLAKVGNETVMRLQQYRNKSSRLIVMKKASCGMVMSLCQLYIAPRVRQVA
mmetsp:Transcript_8116/g.21484  ORF Transcript_8116/g.21484 Transcript_8116/m.21484 type:complete len:95 (+) Transcript_8116:1129-1413(+)